MFFQLTYLIALSMPALLVSEPEATVDALAPLAGANGTVVTVDGVGFGDKRPRAWLQSVDTGKKRRLRVLAFADDQLSVQLRAGRLDPGAHELIVDPHGKDMPPVAAPSTFDVRAPWVERFEPSFVAGETEVDLIGQDFGSLRRPKVRIDGRRARVLSFGENKVRVRLPKKATGDAEVTLKTRIAETLGPCPLYLHGSECTIDEQHPDFDAICPVVSEDFLYLDVEGLTQWVIKPKLDVRLHADGDRLIAQVAQLDDPSGYPAYLRLEFDLDPADDNTPIDDAELSELAYVVFDGSKDGQLWLLADADFSKLEWKTAHCFSFAHVVADLRAQQSLQDPPELRRIELFLRVDTMSVLQEFHVSNAD